MAITISVLAVFVLLAILLQKRRGPSSSNERPRLRKKTDLSATSEFHAVSIRCRKLACEAAQNLRGKRYLSSAAPKLPLEDCDAPECRCRFTHHRDRRANEDRRSSWGGAGQEEEEKRYRPDRRSDGSPDDFFK